MTDLSTENADAGPEELSHGTSSGCETRYVDSDGHESGTAGHAPPLSDESARGEPIVLAETVAPGRPPKIAQRASRPSLAHFHDQIHHVAILGLALAVLLLSLLLTVHEEGYVVVPQVNRSLPGLCAYRQLLGHDCPGCGLTRSFISLAHGNVLGAIRFNPAGLLLFLVVLYQIPYRAIQIGRARSGLWAESTPPRMHAWALYIVLAALIAQWFVRSVGPFFLARLPNHW